MNNLVKVYIQVKCKPQYIQTLKRFSDSFFGSHTQVFNFNNAKQCNPPTVNMNAVCPLQNSNQSDVRGDFSFIHTDMACTFTASRGYISAQLICDGNINNFFIYASSAFPNLRFSLQYFDLMNGTINTTVIQRGAHLQTPETGTRDVAMIYQDTDEWHLIRWADDLQEWVIQLQDTSLRFDALVQKRVTLQLFAQSIEYIELDDQWEDICDVAMSQEEAQAALRPLQHARDYSNDCCSICLDAFQNPQQLKCSHVFCKACAMQAIVILGSCPVCRQQLI